jgi:O-antigen/teichoic acid export membrane protein
VSGTPGAPEAPGTPEAPGAPGTPGAPSGGGVPRLLLKLGSIAFLANVGVLVANTLTGVFTARLLGAEGRGVLTAVVLLPQTVALIGALGAQRAIAYHRARNPEDGATLIATWLVVMTGCWAVTYALAYLLVPVLLAAQPDRAIDYARIYLLTIGTTLVYEVGYGSLLGQQRFRQYSAFLLTQPVLLVIAYTVLWRADAFTLERVLVAGGVIPALLALCALTLAIRRDGFGRPSRALARRTMAYGLRAHGTTVSGLVNARLDLLIIPAFLSAASVGAYAVATNVTVALAGLSGSLAQFVLPLAAKEAARAKRIVIGALWLSMGVAAAGALVLMVIAEVAIRFVYGAEFESSAPLARILVVGVVFSVGAGVLFGGLEALGRPLAASVANAVGATITVGGLVLFLQDNGTTAAAIITTTAGAMSFLAALTLYRRAGQLRLAELVPRPSLLLALVRRRSAPAPADG